jgi:predicted permease
MLSWFRRRRNEQDLDAEIDAHIAMEIQQRVERGESAEEARQNACRDFGNVGLVREVTRGVWVSRFSDRLEQDTRYAIRSLFRTLRTELASTVTIILSLGIAIAANATVFGVINALLLKDQPGIERSEELVDLGQTRRARGFDNMSYPNLADYQKVNDIFSGVAGYTDAPRAMSFRLNGPAERVHATLVTANFFEVLGTVPAAGRLFIPDDWRGANGAVAVISHAYWTRIFNKDTSTVGSKVIVNGSPVTIVGVAAKGFNGVDVTRSDLWIALSVLPFPRTMGSPFDRTANFLRAIGRLKPNVSIHQAQAYMAALSAALEQEHPADNRDVGVRVVRHNALSALPQVSYLFLGMLAAIALLVLFIACANVSGVCLARSAARRRDIGVRLALGASRTRIVSQLLSETAVLFVFAGVIGVTVAGWISAVISRQEFLLDIPIILDLAPDARLVVFTIGLTFIAAVIAGFTPAMHGTRIDPGTAIKTHPNEWMFSRSRLKSVLVVSQIAMALVLLIVGGLFMRVLQHAANVELGFNPNNVEAIALDLFMAGPNWENGERIDVFEKVMLERVRSLPGVESASLATDLPMDGGGMGFGPLTIPGRPKKYEPDWNLVSSRYFDTMRIPILTGRDFSEADGAGVVIINKMMADQLWPGDNAIGKQLNANGHPLQVIGVVTNSNTRWVGVPQRPMLYATLRQVTWFQRYLMIRTSDGRSSVPTLRTVLQELAPNLPILRAQAMTDVTGIGLLPQRIAAWVAGGMGLVGVLLALLGVYGIAAYAVTSRTREIGIRGALGATRLAILKLIWREGLILAVAGVTVGCLLSLAVTPVIGGFLWDVSPADALTFGVVSISLAAAALLACFFPALRATRVEPAVVLRYE